MERFPGTVPDSAVPGELMVSPGHRCTSVGSAAALPTTTDAATSTASPTSNLSLPAIALPPFLAVGDDARPDEAGSPPEAWSIIINRWRRPYTPTDPGRGRLGDPRPPYGRT